MRHRVPEQSDAARIIELFGRPRPVCASEDVLRLLGISDGQLAGAIAAGRVSPEEND